MRRAHVERVEEIRFRRCSAFSGEVLEQAFRKLAVDTPLEHARLTVEVKAVDYTCECGYQQVIRCSDLVEDQFTCPVCSRVTEIKDMNPLELLEVDDAEIRHHHPHMFMETNPELHL